MLKRLALLTMLAMLALVALCAVAGPALAAKQPAAPPSSAVLWPFSQGKTMWTYVDANGAYDVDVIHTEPIPSGLTVWIALGIVESSVQQCLAWESAFRYSATVVAAPGGIVGSLTPEQNALYWSKPYRDPELVPNSVAEFWVPLGHLAPAQHTLTFTESLATPFVDYWWEDGELQSYAYDPFTAVYRSTFTVR